MEARSYTSCGGPACERQRPCKAVPHLEEGKVSEVYRRELLQTSLARKSRENYTAIEISGCARAGRLFDRLQGRPSRQPLEPALSEVEGMPSAKGAGTCVIWEWAYCVTTLTRGVQSFGLAEIVPARKARGDVDSH